MTLSAEDTRLMKRALALAESARDAALPNPSVAALIVKNGKVVGEGVHLRAGEPHGEIHALASAGKRAFGATLYVTLEPCNHHGRTPPCTEAIVNAGIARVVFGASDPNPKVKGGGAKFLMEEGLRVEGGLLAEQAARVHAVFLVNVRHNRAFVHLKMAATLDGHPADREGASLYITGDKARQEVFRMRGRYGAVMVGAGTVSADQPRLTDRRARGASVTRIIPWLTGPEPDWTSLLEGAPRNPLWIFHGAKKPRMKTGRGVRLFAAGRAGLRGVLARLPSEGIHAVLCEGGPGLAGELFAAGLVDRYTQHVAPRVLADGEAPALLRGGAAYLPKAGALGPLTVRKLGDDAALEVEVHVHRDH